MSETFHNFVAYSLAIGFYVIMIGGFYCWYREITAYERDERFKK